MAFVYLTDDKTWKLDFFYIYTNRKIKNAENLSVSKSKDNVSTKNLWKKHFCWLMWLAVTIQLTSAHNRILNFSLERCPEIWNIIMVLWSRVNWHKIVQSKVQISYFNQKLQPLTKRKFKWKNLKLNAISNHQKISKATRKNWQGQKIDYLFYFILFIFLFVYFSWFSIDTLSQCIPKT